MFNNAAASDPRQACEQGAGTADKSGVATRAPP